MADTAIKKLTSMEPYSVTEPSPYEAALKEVGYEKPKTEQQEKFLKEKAETDIKVAREKKRLGEESLKRTQEIYDRPELQQQKLDAFTPSQESGSDLAKLFALTTAIAFIGGGRGRYSGMTAMNNLASAMEGYRKGRKDLFAQEMKEYDKNMKASLENNRIIQEHLKKYLELAAKKDANAATELEMIKALTGRQGALAEIEKLTENDKAKVAETLAKSRADWKKHVDDMMEKERRHKEIMAQRQERINAANLKSLAGPRSAINERYATTVYRSANEVLRSLELIEQIGISTGGGALGGVVGKGTIPSEVQRYIGQAMTNEQEKNYNSAMSGIALELAYVLNGGYKPDQGTVNKIETLLSVGPNDTVGNAAYKFADVSAKLKAAIEVNPAYTEDQKNIREKLMKKLDRYVTPEVVYQRVYGVPERKESVVRSGEYPKPQTQEEFDALEPGTEYIDPDDNKVYTKRGK